MSWLYGIGTLLGKRNYKLLELIDVGVKKHHACSGNYNHGAVRAQGLESEHLHFIIDFALLQ